MGEILCWFKSSRPQIRKRESKRFPLFAFLGDAADLKLCGRNTRRLGASEAKPACSADNREHVRQVQSSASLMVSIDDILNYQIVSQETYQDKFLVQCRNLWETGL